MGIFSQNNPTYHAANLLSPKVIEVEQNFQYNIFETQLKDITCIIFFLIKSSIKIMPI